MFNYFVVFLVNLVILAMSKSYFEQLNQTLKNYQRAIPCLLIDLDKVDQNLAVLQKDLQVNTSFRIVVKSLPSLELIQYVMQEAGTEKLMVFHQPFLTALAESLSANADVLLGKPMPIKTATYFYKNLPENNQGFNPYQQIQWLVDTETRIQEYIDLAKQLGQPLRLNLEIDVGLHRGGFKDIAQFKVGLQLIEQHKEWVNLSGLMGYDPHVVKLPSFIRSKEKAARLANQFYKQCKETLQQDFPNLWSADLTFNGAGSPTLALHKKDSPLNDVSAGSCIVMPTTFDMPTLDKYQAACFIASPVLKAFEGTTLPALEKMTSFLNLISSSNQQSFYIYGGFWKADYCYPIGVKQNSMFISTNQTMLNAPSSVQLKVEDFVFLRPHQSEFVFLQFGNILPIRNEEIMTPWSILKNY